MIGALINACTVELATPLFMAAQEGRYDVVEYLLENGADPDCRTVKGASALHVAAEKGFPGMLPISASITPY